MINYSQMRMGPSSYAAMPMPANMAQMGRGLFNTQATAYGYGNSPLQSPYASMIGQSPMMQQYLPSYQQKTMLQQQQASPFQWGPQNPFNNRTAEFPWYGNGPRQMWSSTGLPPGQNPQAAMQSQQAATPNVNATRQAWHPSITPDQAALRGGADGNKDFRASLTPEQIALQQAAQATRTGQPAQQAQPQQMQQQQIMQLLQQLMGGQGLQNLGMGFM